MTKKTIAFKGFDKDMKCRGYQFEVGKSYTHEGNIELCESGFHACENPLDVLSYYDLTNSRFAIVELVDAKRNEDSDSKFVAATIKIDAEISIGEFVTKAVDWVVSFCQKNSKGKAASSGDYSTAASSGNSSTAASSGYSSTAASSGDYSKAASSGDYSKAASSGNSSTAASSGDYSTAASSGDYSTAASSGNSSKAASSGNSSTAASSGNSSTAIPRKLRAAEIPRQLRAAGIPRQRLSRGKIRLQQRLGGMQR